MEIIQGKFYLLERHEQNPLEVFVYRIQDKQQVQTIWVCYIADDKLKTKPLSTTRLSLIENPKSLISKFVQASQKALVESFQARGFLAQGSIPITTAEHYRILGLLLRFYGERFLLANVLD